MHSESNTSSSVNCEYFWGMMRAVYSFRPHTEKKRMLTLWGEPIRSGELIVLTCRIRKMAIPTHGRQDSDCNKNFHDRFRLGLRMVHSLSIFTPRKLSGKLGNELEIIGLIKPYSRNSCSFGWLINIWGALMFLCVQTRKTDRQFRND